MPDEHPDAPAEKREKYARRERERRFLLAAFTPDEGARATSIVDRYLEGTRLRLREATTHDANGAARTVYKLTQKIRAGTSELVTTTYLNRDEHALLATLPARVLVKTRVAMPPFGIDVFAPPRDGLVLAEIEAASDELLAAASPPSAAVAEVTTDPRFTGARLARASREEIAAWSLSYGLTLPSTR